MRNLIKDIHIAEYEDGTLVFILVSKEMFINNLINSLSNPLIIKSQISSDKITVFIPSLWGNETTIITKNIDDNDNWINIRSTRLYTVGYRHEDQIKLLMPERTLHHSDT